MLSLGGRGLGYSPSKMLYRVWVWVLSCFGVKIAIDFNQLLTESGKIGTNFRGEGSIFESVWAQERFFKPISWLVVVFCTN